MEADTAQKLSAIFSSAGQAFTQMAELTMQLQSNDQAKSLNGKWTEKEVDMLKGAVERFGSDLSKIGTVIKSRTQDEIKRQATGPTSTSKASPVKGNENLPSRQIVTQKEPEKKPRLPPPAPLAASPSGPPVIRTLSNAVTPAVIAPPLVLNTKPASAGPVKEQKARRGGPRPLRSGPGPASRTKPRPESPPSNLPQGGPMLASMLDSGKRTAASAGLTDYRRLKLMREAEEDDYSESESDEDTDLNDSTEDDDD